jgi:site-specific recombinase XerD
MTCKRRAPLSRAKRARPSRRRPLPAEAERFVQTLTATHRPGTCHCYRTALRRLYLWLDERGIPVDKLDRTEVVHWLRQLHRQGLAAQTRNNYLAFTYGFLRWLHEQGRLQTDPDRLIRTTDFPRVPDLLPRPFPPQADRELMRNAGLRIGELMALEYDCLRADSTGHLLKVPLGKLYNERLVPLDADTVRLVRKLQTIGPRSRPWLLTTPSGAKTYRRRYARALLEACHGLAIDGRITTHRLRHTYATSLLSGGISLVGLMRLLGHRAYKTTLRYAAVTQETIGREYFQALTNIEARYQQHLHASTTPEPEPTRMLSDVARWIHNHIAHDRGLEPTARRLIKRLNRVQAELRALAPRGTRA